LQIRIFVAHHSYFHESLPVPLLEDIVVGAARNPIFAHGVLTDDVGTSISSLNPLYSELTAQFWALNNLDLPDRIGFFHYRRLLSFATELSARSRLSIHGIIESTRDREMFESHGFFGPMPRTTIENSDLVVPKPFDVRSVGFPTLFSHYRSSPHHRESDLIALKNSVNSIAPWLLTHLEHVLRGHELYAGNMYVMSRELFKVYGTLVFDVLDHVSQSIMQNGRSRQELRVLGYLSERIFTAFLRAYRQAAVPGLSPGRVSEVPTVFLENATDNLALTRAADATLPTFVLATDRWYAPHTAAAIASIAQNFPPLRKFNVFILHSELDSESKRKLNFLGELNNSASIHLVDMGTVAANFPVHSHFATPTYFRLLIPDLFPNFSKIVYIDSDVVVDKDPSRLFEFANDSCVAAAKDIIFAGFTRKGVPSTLETGSLPAEKYAESYLGLSRVSSYFQAGVLVMNLDKIRLERRLSRDGVGALLGRPLWFLDQDVLNIVFGDDVEYLPNEFNSVYVPEDLSCHLAAADHKAYISSRVSPAIIHFAGGAKPWDTDSVEFSGKYFEYLRKTQFYEEIANRRLINHFTSKPKRNKMLDSAVRWGFLVWTNLPSWARVALGPVSRFVRRVLN